MPRFLNQLYAKISGIGVPFLFLFQRMLVGKAPIEAFRTDQESLVKAEKAVYPFPIHQRTVVTALSICVFSILFLSFLSFFVSDFLLNPALKYIPKILLPTFPAREIAFCLLLVIIGASLWLLQRAFPYPSRATAMASVALCALHVYIFRKHYFHGYGFPWDFVEGYYTSITFWISTLRNGIVPAWIPFQQMGYPIDLNLQIGIHYPLFWIFPLLKITYTLNQAARFQALHVLLGSLGMFCLARTKYPKISYAFLAAAAFQFFGGFYSNSQHADIVRSFALIPWLLYACTLNTKGESPLCGRNILVSPIILLLATGGYPGNFVAGLLACGFYVATQLLVLQRNTKSLQKTIHTGLWLAALTILGLAMACFHLAPAFMERGYLARYQSLNGLVAIGFERAHLPGLFLTNRCIPGEITMVSSFVTLPVIVLAFFISWNYLKNVIEVFALGVFSVLLGGGPNSPVWLFLVKLVPQAGYSRFPISDYKIFLAISIILLSLGGIGSIAEGRDKIKVNALKTGIAMLFFQICLIVGLTNVFSDPYHAPLTRKAAMEATLIFVSSIALIWLFLLNKKIPANAFVVAITLLTLLNGTKVINKIILWKVPGVNNLYSTAFKFPLITSKGELISDSVFAQSPSVRPARILGGGMKDFSWKGYLSGEYFMDDKAPNLLSSSASALNNPIYGEYMRQPWTPILIPEPDADMVARQASLPDQGLAEEKLAHSQANGFVKQTKYGINEITYDVELDSRKLLIENEIYFPGWKAVLEGGNVEHSIEPIDINHVFRGWLLPAGKYKMIARFTFPNHYAYISASATATLLWAILSLYFISRRNQAPSRPPEFKET